MVAYSRLNQREDYQGYGDVVYNYRSNIPEYR